MKPTFLLPLALAALAAPAQAIVPMVLIAEGRFTKADGSPETGPLDVHFSLYDVPTGGDPTGGRACGSPSTRMATTESVSVS